MVDWLILAIPDAMVGTAAQKATGVDGLHCELLAQVGWPDPLLLALGQAIFEHLLCGGPLGMHYIDTLLGALTVHLLRRRAEFPVRVAQQDGCLATPVLRSVLDYIDSHLDQTLTLNDIAALAQYSPYHFGRCFRNSTGHSLHQYVLTHRLEKAKHLIEHTDLGIAEVALRTGFSDHSHLTSQFRRAFHVTPAKYRTQLKP